MYEHSFDAFSLKMKESGSKKGCSASRSEILRVKVDDLTGYETCHIDEKQRLKHVPCPHAHAPWSHAYVSWQYVQVLNRKPLRSKMSYTVDQIHNNPWLSVQDVVGDAKTWPKFIRAMFWDRNFNDHHRMIIVNFAFVNHISEEFLHDVL